MADQVPAMIYTWDGEGLRPHNLQFADRHFVIGERYRMLEELDRSVATHRHFFAVVNEAFENLPEHLEGQWESAEHFRKWALIQVGYRTQIETVCVSKIAAVRQAALVQALDEYAVVVVDGKVVTIFRAKSQSTRAMGAKSFQKVKEDVLALLAALINVTPETLSKQAEAA